MAHSQTFPNIGCMRSHMDMHFMLIMSIVVMRDPMVHFGPSTHVRFVALQMIDLFRGLELNMWSVELIT